MVQRSGGRQRTRGRERAGSAAGGEDRRSVHARGRVEARCTGQPSRRCFYKRKMSGALLPPLSQRERQPPLVALRRRSAAQREKTPARSRAPLVDRLQADGDGLSDHVRRRRSAACRQDTGDGPRRRRRAQHIGALGGGSAARGN